MIIQLRQHLEEQLEIPVHFLHIVQGELMPCATIRQSTLDSNHSLTAKNGFHHTAVQISLWDMNYSDLCDLSQALIDAYDGALLHLGDYTCQFYLEDAEDDVYPNPDASDNWIFSKTVTFRIHYKTLISVPASGGIVTVRGYQGDDGAQGPQGFQGPQGSQGASGIGSQGAQGANGSIGAQGYQGASNTGSQGSQGAQGPQGYQGSNGEDGEAGPQGYQGDNGANGAQGYQGASGTGSQGAQGSQGANGDNVEYLDVLNIDVTDDYRFYGGTFSDGSWKINRFDRTTYLKTEATLTNNPTYTVYATAWTDREVLIYG